MTGSSNKIVTDGRTTTKEHSTFLLATRVTGKVKPEAASVGPLYSLHRVLKEVLSNWLLRNMHVSTSPTTLTPTPDRTLDQSLNTLFAVPWHAGLYFRALTSAGESIVSQTQYLQARMKVYIRRRDLALDGCEGPKGERVSRIYGEMQQVGVHNLSHGL